MNSEFKWLIILIAVVMVAGPLGITFSKAEANSTAQPLPFSQDWSDTGLISTNDDWSGVLGIMGYRGDNLTSTIGTDPQTILQPDDPGVVDVNANQTNPNTFTTGGVTEFELTDPVVALAGSGTADAPYLLILINTTGMTTIQVSYDLRDLETGGDDAIQQVALHYRVGNSGNFTNIPEAYVADATIGNDVKTTHVSVTLPSACDNAALVQLRIMTTNAVGSDEWVGVDNISITGTPAAGDTAPTVVSTVPADGGTLAKDGDIVITFSEPVTVAEGWFDIICTDSGTHTADVTDDDPVYTLDPDTDFTGGESCTVTVYAAKVTDDDTEDPPDNMASDYSFTFNVAYGCGDPYTAISAIQGEGMSTPLSGQVVSTEGIVVADYQTNEYVSGTRNGFFMQSITPDADPNTSEGLFVYSYLVDVAVGDHVRVTGTASEYYDLTQLSSVSQIQVCSSGNSVTPTSFELPATSLLDFERLEGMLVTIPQDLVISEYYNFDRYGEIVLTTERFMTFTAVNEPSVDGFAAWQEAFKLNSITLDDGRESQNPDPAIHPNGEEFTLENRFRGGDLVSDVTGVMDYEFSKYRIQPTQGANYTEANPRPETPELAPGFLKVASFNVLNYFTTIDTGAWICGPSGDMECRGADTAEELTRQRAKILAALSGIDADIFGIIEIENDRPLGEGESPDYAVADLVAGLNDTFGEGTFAYIATGAIGTDAIKQAIIYKPAAVTPVGEFQLLTTAVDPRFIDTLNRPVLAQVFEDNFTGETFVVAVNHLKSKGSACPDDPDLLDGQGNCNLTRKNAALALVDWLANTEYFPDVENALIIGDLNSYDHEDPIDMIKLGADDIADTPDDFHDMMAEFRGEYAYGYVYDGQIGYLDYALANASLAERIVDVNFWHINADEPDILNYDMDFKQDAQDELYAPDAYRSSDHDPVVISISFNAAPVAEDMEVSTPEDTALDITLDVSDANDDPLTAEIVTGPMHGAYEIDGLVVTYTPDADYNGPDSFTYKVSDGELESDTATVSITVTPVNDAPVANDMTETTAEDTAKTITLDATDIDGDALTAEIFSGPMHGQVSVSGLIVTYTPDANYNGPDSFTYKVNDGQVYSNIATVTITVTPVNDAPVAVSFEVELQENSSVTFDLLAYDVEDDPLTYNLVSGPARGTLNCAGVNCTYTPNPHWFGMDSFIFTANDGLLDSNEATVTLNVIPLPRIYLPIIFR
ncbi:MAG TPA: hypothetical protein DCG78_03760 [Anaerolineaceae bacterium]|nr:MAG: hypothetical protein XD89_0487 [Anaerolineae bacterium 49_20]HAE85610.1 hypothetical protein [Anaerolineaceae bacterium]